MAGQERVERSSVPVTAESNTIIRPTNNLGRMTGIEPAYLGVKDQAQNQRRDHPQNYGRVGEVRTLA